MRISKTEQLKDMDDGTAETLKKQLRDILKMMQKIRDLTFEEQETDGEKDVSESKVCEALQTSRSLD